MLASEVEPEPLHGEIVKRASGGDPLRRRHAPVKVVLRRRGGGNAHVHDYTASGRRWERGFEAEGNGNKPGPLARRGADPDGRIPVPRLARPDGFHGPPRSTFPDDGVRGIHLKTASAGRVRHAPGAT